MKSIVSLFPRPLMLLAIAATWMHAPATFAHGGEDHGDASATVHTAQVLAPRAEAASDEVEMLGIYDSKVLTVFLSRFDTNAPIANAQVEIESGANKAIARPVADGMYKADASWLAQPGHHSLVVTVQSPEINDLLETTLDVPDAAEVATTSPVAALAPAGLIGSVGGVVLLGVLAFGFLRRKK